MDVSFDSVDSVYESFDSTYDLPGLQYEPTNQECDFTDYDPYVSTENVCEQTEIFDSVDSVYQSMDWPYGLTGLQCEPTSSTNTPINWEYYLKDYDPDTPTEEPFEQTEGKAWRLLAARIPQELFDDILFYVNVDRVSQRQEDVKKYGRDLIRNRGEPILGDILTHLKQCSLVCLFWANRCRSHMFSEETVRIMSYEDAEIFRRYVVGGCQRLTPVNQLIRAIGVRQDYQLRRSFIHLLHLPAIKDKLTWLFIGGPVPDTFTPAKLDTPHWGIPPSIFVPSSIMQKKVFLCDVHLPSFYHVTKYIRHFACATWIHFGRITWDGQTPTYSLPQASNKINCQRRPRSLRIEVLGGCTNSVHLALTAMMMNPNCPLHRLSDEERVWMIKFMTLLWGHKKEHDVPIGFNILEQATTMELDPFYFVFGEASASTDRSVSALSVVGIHAYIWGDWSIQRKLPANFDALVNSLRTHPTIRALVLLFDSLDRLQNSVKPFIEVLVLAAETIELVLAYEEDPKAVGVDLVTLEPNGRVDTWADEQSEDYWGRQLSSQMLQRQLKKKRWMSAH